MIQLKLLRGHEQWKKGEVIEVNKNEAHTLIDRGVAKIFVAYENKMMVSKQRRFKQKVRKSYVGKHV